jgi:gamma-glutamyltranspeptidase/glutathione hydrolase
LLQLLIPRECARSGGKGRTSLLALACFIGSQSSIAAAETSSTAPVYLHARHGAVACDSRLASEAGVRALRAGGNAVDAACAAALALGVTNPFASGLGGGGFALVYLAKPAKAMVLDFRERAPAALRPGANGRIEIPPQSGLSVGVPGEARGLHELVKRFGALPFARCVAPALRLARGFPLSAWTVEKIEQEIASHPTTGEELIRKVFALGNEDPSKLRAGTRVSRPDLARTLRRLQSRGAEALYTGTIARDIVAATRAARGVLTLADLSDYRPIERQPLDIDFLGKKVLTVPPPSAGGVILMEALGTLAHRLPEIEHSRVDGLASPLLLHFMVESLKHAFADRARFMGDPAFVDLPLQHLLDPEYHRELAGRIRRDGVLRPAEYGTGQPRPAQPARDAGTAHISVVDKEGNAVALTTTVNLEFGARIVAGRSGIVLNDELDDFTPSPDHPDVFAIAGSAANQAAPGKRPISSMTPTIVLDKRGVAMVTGAAGGPRIVSATLQMLIDVLLLGMDAETAVRAPRVHHQWQPEVLFYEAAVPATTLQALKKLGHATQLREDIGKANLIVRAPDGLTAATDPRAGGAPAGY